MRPAGTSHRPTGLKSTPAAACPCSVTRYPRHGRVQDPWGEIKIFSDRAPNYGKIEKLNILQ